MGGPMLRCSRRWEDSSLRYDGRADKLRVVRRTSTKLPSHLDDVDGWHRLVELQQTGRQKKQKSDSPPRGSFHQRLQSFGTGWLPGCICSMRLLYIWLRAVKCNAHGDECASFCSVAVQYVEMEAIRVLAQGMTSSQGLILILWRVYKGRVWCVIRANGGTWRNGWNAKHLPLLYHAEFPTQRKCQVKIWIMKAQWWFSWDGLF